MSSMNHRPGFALPMVLFVLVLLAGAAISYHQYATYSQSLAFRIGQGDIARRLAESAINEAFMWFWRETGVPGTPAANWMLQNDATTFPIPVTLVESEAKNMVRGRMVPISVIARHVDSRTIGSLGTPFSGKERLGTIALEATAEIRRLNAQKEAGCLLIRHYDYQIAAIVSAAGGSGGRTRYSPAFPLDYALLIRNGVADFSQTNGKTLNPPQGTLEVINAPSSNQRGKVFFGGVPKPAGQAPATVFVNIDDSLKQIIPQPLKTEYRLDLDECLTLLPSLKGFKKQLSGMEGVITVANLPIRPNTATDQLEKDALSHLQATGIGAETNLFAGIKPLAIDPQTACDPSYAASVFQGGVRQRFLHFATFRIDLSKVAQAPPNTPNPLPCLLKYSGMQKQEAEDFRKGLKQLSEQKYGSDIICHLNSDYLYKGGQTAAAAPPNETFEWPKFFNSQNKPITVIDTGDDGFNVYDHFDLWAKGYVSVGDFLAQGLIDLAKGQIFPRGVIMILQGNLVIGDDPTKTLTIHGRGAILAESITIVSGLKKATDDDFLVLNSFPGNITIQTSQPVEASLIATNHNRAGTVQAQKPLCLKGSLSTDFIDLSSWATGKHQVTYDPGLQPNSDVLAITLTQIPTFQRMTESDND